MSSTRIKLLKEIAEEMAEAATAEEQLSLLTKSFELFSEETERLDKAYGELRSQFRAVNQKLEETNSKLSNKVQELHVLTSYLDNILSHMAQGILFVDMGGNLTTYNQSAESILEIPRNELLFQKFTEHFDDNMLGFSLAKALELRKAPKTAFTTLTFPDGRKKHLEIENTFLLHKPTDAPELDFTQGLIVMIRDITELKELQIQASRQDRMSALGEMAAQVAHEIRNPLGGIKGFAKLLERDLKDDPDKKKLAEYISEGADTLDRLVSQVLNYSRPVSLQLKETRLAPLLKEWTEALKADTSHSADSTITLQVGCDPLVLLDPGLFKLALNNLAINAIQAMPQGGKLTITLNSETDHVLLSIADTGCGIPQEHLKKLFSPFFSTKANGNGLGLAETHKVIQAHGGEISVETEMGKGSIFSIKLPSKG